MDKLISFFIIFKDISVSIGRWIQTHSAFVTAAATFAIAAFTFALVWANRKLWKESQEHSRHMEESITVAQRAAEAAEKSADALPAIERAYLFVFISPKDESNKFDIGDNFGQIIITNCGRTPAIIKDIIAISGYLSGPPAICHGEPIPIPWHKTIIAGRPHPDEEQTIDVRFNIANSDQLEDVKREAPMGVFIHGCIKYEDIFRNLQETRFYWKYIYSCHTFIPVEDSERNYRT